METTSWSGPTIKLVSSLILGKGKCNSRFDSHKDIMRNATKELRSLPEMLPAVEGMLG
jgi:hypothetical protein